jgi:hypothetical protein
VMRAIALIEEHITLQELLEYAQRGKAPLGRVSNAYAAVLRFAGCKVDDGDVYLGMFSDDAGRERMLSSVNGLLMMMLPPEVQKRMFEGKPAPKPVLAKGEKEPELGNSPAPAKGASKSSTKRSRRKDGARHLNSGA